MTGITVFNEVIKQRQSVVKAHRTGLSRLLSRLETDQDSLVADLMSRSRSLSQGERTNEVHMQQQQQGTENALMLDCSR